MSNNGNRSLVGRNIQLVSDLSRDEQRYLYSYSAKYKKAILERDYEFISSHIINNQNFSTYLVFQESSTRTKESFYNASVFHKVRTKDFSMESSSLAKNETLSDTIKILMGYAEQSCFIVRSSIEGVCRWLEISLKEYSERNGITTPICINAGDGRNEHPTQEFLDEFSFQEYYKGDYSRIHIALIGDLLHGRTIHSKVDGLKVFNEIEVDLIAPQELSLPKHYIKEMKESQIEVRIFDSISSYLTQTRLADIWYFTRLQSERISDNLIPHLERLRSKITVDESMRPLIPDNTKFFHPLPRDKLAPTIPYSFDDTSLNGWEQQALNGFYTRISLLSMLSGVIGKDFEGESLHKKNYLSNFIEEINVAPQTKHSKPKQKIGIKPVENGIVIDHIAEGKEIPDIWNRINIIRDIMKLNLVSSHGVYKSYSRNLYKGIISLPDYEVTSETETNEFKKLGVMSPGCTINIISNSKVIKKLKISLPPRIYNFKEISCMNPRCISFSDNKEHAYADFYRKGSEYYCNYCKTLHDLDEIWNLTI